MTQDQLLRGARLLAHPKRLEMLLHVGKSLKLGQAVITDRRIAFWRKAIFFGSIAALIIVLFFPDILGEVVLSTILPVIGTVLGVPLDAGFDWVTFIIVVTSLLRLFPADIVAQHYQQIFG